MREIGEVCYADVFKDGTGVVEFAKKDDMLYALKKMDESRFRSHEVLVINILFCILVSDFFIFSCLGRNHVYSSGGGLE